MAIITEAFVNQYESNVRHLSQQMDFRFAGKSDTKDMTGEFNFLENLDTTTANQILGRTQQTNITDPNHQRRAITAAPYDVAHLLDENDEYTLLIEPTSKYAKSQAAAINRVKDTVFITAALGNALGGKQGTTNVALPAAQKVAVNYTGGVAANAGLTLAKLIEAKRILDSNEVNPYDKKYMVVSSKQLHDLLLNVNQVSSADYSNVKALWDGDVNYFMGFEFIRTEQLPYEAGAAQPDYRQCFAYSENCMVMGQHYDIKSHIDVRTDLSHAIQVRSVWNGGATRRDDKGVVQITCDESP